MAGVQDILGPRRVFMVSVFRDMPGVVVAPILNDPSAGPCKFLIVFCILDRRQYSMSMRDEHLSSSFSATFYRVAQIA